MNTEVVQPRTTPRWDLYRRECFMLAAKQQKPLFDTDPEALEERAKQTLSEGGWLYAWSVLVTDERSEASCELMKVISVCLFLDFSGQMPEVRRRIERTGRLSTGGRSSRGCWSTRTSETRVSNCLDIE